MTPKEVGHVLAKAAAYDQRTVGRADILAWHEVLSDVDYEDALTAVARHYAEHTPKEDRLAPAHIRRIAEQLWRERRRAQLHRVELEAAEAERADPSRRDRSAQVDAELARLREQLPPGDRDRLRRAEVLGWNRDRARHARPQVPNPHYAGPPPLGGWPLPSTEEET